MTLPPNRPIKTQMAERSLGETIRLLETDPRPRSPTAVVFTALRGAALLAAARSIAKRFDRDIYRIDLSAVVSKYIGETEKNLRRLLDKAQSAGAILLFDEADVLFGKRTEVKDSHDRYIKIEHDYLLQKLKNYRGIVVLSRRRAVDMPPKSRRIRFLLARRPPRKRRRVLPKRKGADAR
jgi:SpoVK/Ycf46/Vps4 family AAA+-type ATPase